MKSHLFNDILLHFDLCYFLIYLYDSSDFGSKKITNIAVEPNLTVTSKWISGSIVAGNIGTFFVSF